MTWKQNLLMGFLFVGAIAIAFGAMAVLIEVFHQPAWISLIPVSIVGGLLAKVARDLDRRQAESRKQKNNP